MMKMIIFLLFLLMEHQWNETEGEKELLRQKPVPVPLYPSGQAKKNDSFARGRRS
jgi:hypothetical protein